MELRFENYEYQTEAVDSLVSVFKNVNFNSENNKINPVFSDFDIVKKNIENIRIKNGTCIYKNYFENTKNLILDIKMETGTGKTFVYVKTIFELNKQYGVTKFIIAVPSLSIKKGTENFIKNSRQYFRDIYSKEIDLTVADSNMGDASIVDYLEGDDQNRIYVLLMNSDYAKENTRLTKISDSLFLDDYETPAEAIKALNPILIIDEPHRYKTGNNNFNNLINCFNPLFIIRYGATFPETPKDELNDKKDKENVHKKYHYANLLYNFTSAKAFAGNFVKGVSQYYVTNQGKDFYKIESIEGGCVNISKNGKKAQKFSIGNIKDQNDDFPNYEINNIQGEESARINNIDVYKGDIFNYEFSDDYHEKMIELALEKHFEIEEENFEKGIKTICLFFIGNIKAYRNTNGSIRKKYETQLKNILGKIKNTKNSKYRKYIIDRLNNIDSCHCGYFSGDLEDPKYKDEADLILNDKSTLLSLNDNHCFIFSQWALKEGWDLPNVFTICKLRTSGSDTSKLQEIGRGLRLPVDKDGNRISKKITGESFFLNYIVTESEKDFAERLIKEIETDSDMQFDSISSAQIRRVINSNNSNVDNIEDLYDEELMSLKEYIHIFSDNGVFKIKEDKKNDFLLSNKYKDYDFSDIHKKIVNKTDQPENNNKVEIKESVFLKLSKLWKIINKVVFLKNKFIDLDECDAINYSFRTNNVFDFENNIAQGINVYGDLTTTNSSVTLSGYREGMPYGQFLKELGDIFCIDINLIHEKLYEYLKENNKLENKYLTQRALSKIKNNYFSWLIDNALDKIEYIVTDINPKETALTDENGKMKKEISYEGLGRVIKEGIHIPQKYLYNKAVGDSNIEFDNIQDEQEKVEAFGKIPKSSIQIPTPIGTYSPDFMYIIKKDREFKLIVETKGYENKTDIPKDEQFKIECAKKYFEALANYCPNESCDLICPYKIEFQTQTNNHKLSKIIESL